MESLRSVSLSLLNSLQKIPLLDFLIIREEISNPIAATMFNLLLFFSNLIKRSFPVHKSKIVLAWKGICSTINVSYKVLLVR
jgi:hypothetical protein